MAKMPLTPVLMIDKLHGADARDGAVILSLVSHGAMVRLRLEPRAARELASWTMAAAGEAIEQRLECCEVIPFPETRSA